MLISQNHILQATTALPDIINQMIREKFRVCAWRGKKYVISAKCNGMPVYGYFKQTNKKTVQIMFDGKDFYGNPIEGADLTDVQVSEYNE